MLFLCCFPVPGNIPFLLLADVANFFGLTHSAVILGYQSRANLFTGANARVVTDVLSGSLTSQLTLKRARHFT